MKRCKVLSLAAALWLTWRFYAILRASSRLSTVNDALRRIKGNFEHCVDLKLAYDDDSDGHHEPTLQVEWAGHFAYNSSNIRTANQLISEAFAVLEKEGLPTPVHIVDTHAPIPFASLRQKQTSRHRQSIVWS